jgi:enterochelin esterase-like enzyme
MLLTEIIPRVEATYRVSRKREDRALAGFSMGGAEAVTIGLENSRMFAWIGGFSPAFARDQTPIVNIDPDKANLRLLWMSYGLEDPFVKIGNERFASELRDLGFPITVDPIRGGHAFRTAEQTLERFAPLLFEPTER